MSWPRIMCSQVRMLKFLEPSREMPQIRVFEGKKLFLTSLKQTCNEYLIKFSKNQSAPKLENRKTSPCSPCAPNLLHVLISRIPGYHNLCSPVASLVWNVNDLSVSLTQWEKIPECKIFSFSRCWGHWVCSQFALSSKLIHWIKGFSYNSIWR